MPITIPSLDTRDEDEVVADVIDALPAELTDRNRSSPVVALVEGLGAFYGALLYQMDQIPERLERIIIKLLGLEPEAALAASVTLTFTTGAGAGDTLVPAGTEIKTGTDVDAIVFTTDVGVTVLGGGNSEPATATATTLGAATNVGAGSLTSLGAPIPGIASVTNASSATGGQDEETFASLQARTPLAQRVRDRVVTAEDAAAEAAAVPGVTRATAQATSFLDGSSVELGDGGMVVGILKTDDLNETPDATLRGLVETTLEGKAMAGATFTVHQQPVRLFNIVSVDAVLEEGAVNATVKAAMVEALEGYVTALPIYDTDGVTVVQEGWVWGESLYLNEMISLLDQVDGVKRIGTIAAEASDDYGASWFAAVLTDLRPGVSGDLTDAFGLFDWGGDHVNATTMTLFEV